jgi:hypothetical protein
VADFQLSSPHIIKVKCLHYWTDFGAKKRIHTSTFLRAHFSVLFTERANIANIKLKSNLTTYSTQLKDLSNYQDFRHNFSSEEVQRKSVSQRNSEQLLQARH